MSWKNRLDQDPVARGITPEMVAREMVGKWPMFDDSLASTGGPVAKKMLELRKALIEFQIDYQTSSPNDVRTDYTNQREGDEIMKVINGYEALYKKAGVTDSRERLRRFNENQSAVQQVVDQLHYDLMHSKGQFSYLGN